MCTVHSVRVWTEALVNSRGYVAQDRGRNSEFMKFLFVHSKVAFEVKKSSPKK